MIVEAFKDTLELGLQKPKQTVVSSILVANDVIPTNCTANDPHLRLWLANWSGSRRLFGSGSR